VATGAWSLAEQGKGVLTFRIVSLGGILIAAVAGVRTWLKSDFREEFSSKFEFIRLEQRQASDRDALEERQKRDREAAEERHMRDREDTKEMASQMRQLADSVNAVQLTTARLLELYTKALDEKKKE
jgi:hypothetical protein